MSLGAFHVVVVAEITRQPGAIISRRACRAATTSIFMEDGYELEAMALPFKKDGLSVEEERRH